MTGAKQKSKHLNNPDFRWFLDTFFPVLKEDVVVCKFASALYYYKLYNDGDLTFRDFMILTQQSCFWCGSLPYKVSNVHLRRKNSEYPASSFLIENGSILRNGLDRINNNEKHNLNNVIPSCEECNKYRGKKTVEEFIFHITLWLRFKEQRIKICQEPQKYLSEKLSDEKFLIIKNPKESEYNYACRRSKANQYPDGHFMSGNKCGHLILVEKLCPVKDASGVLRPLWKVKCELCEDFTEKMENRLQHGIKSCGKKECSVKIRKENGRKELLSNSKEECRYLLVQQKFKYAIGYSECRGYNDEDLTLELFNKFIQLPCSYCGRKEVNKFAPNKNCPGFSALYQENMILKYNGLDRIDNSKGHFADNILPCCGDCNKARRNLKLNEFVDRIDQIICYFENLKLNIENITTYAQTIIEV